MRFDVPEALWILAIAVPALAAFFYWSWSVKQKLILQFVRARLLPSLTMGVSARRQKIRLVLVAVAVAFVLLALARPQWGFAWEEAHQRGLDIIVAVDTSRSMLAQDVRPDRLDKTKLAIMDLMRQAKSDRLGLVVFAGSAFLQAPLTVDDQAFEQAVESVTVGIVPEGGTSLSSAIQTSLDSFDKGDANHKAIVLFTDGEDHDADAETMAAAKRAADEGALIFTVGVGTPQGELLKVMDDQGNVSYVKDADGNVVKSRLNETLLRRIATVTHGFYLPLQGADPMATLYERGLAPLPKNEENTRLTRVYRERYHWPLTLAVLLLVIEILLPESPRTRRRERPPVPSARSAAAATAALLILLPIRARASAASALRAYEAGDFKNAFEEFSRLADIKTNDYRLSYDAGTAAYRAKKFEDAAKRFGTALSSPGIVSDLPAQQHAFYNLGNTLFREGEPLPDPDKKKKLWEQSIENYNRALELAQRLSTNDADAKMNLAYVKQELEKLKQQQQQNQNQQNQEDLKPSDAAKQAKERADEAVRGRQYKQALEIMEDSLKQDETTKFYADYIKRLQEINGVAAPVAAH